MNKFKHNGNGTTTIIIESRKYGTKEVCIDTEDWDRVGRYHWNLNRNVRNKRKNVYYVVSTCNLAIKELKRGVKLHRLIVNCPEGMVVDHVSTNTLNNKKSNLRIVTTTENKHNRAKPRGGKNKYIGVIKNSRGSTWMARIGDGRSKHRHIGSFKTEKLAAEARDLEVCRTRNVVSPSRMLNFPERYEEYLDIIQLEKNSSES